MTEPRLISAESVTEGHPDKLCDQISDAVLDDLLRQDPYSHVAVETAATRGQFLVFGEVGSTGYSDVQAVVRSVVREVGYTNSALGLDADSCGVLVGIGQQSPEINQGVQRVIRHANMTPEELDELYVSQGAGDQGVVFGYACSESPTLMPLPITISSRMAQRLAVVRKTGEVKGLRPDGKTQITLHYDDQGNPLSVDTVVVSSQHDPEISQETLRSELKEHVIMPVLNDICADRIEHEKFRLLVNPTGSFVLGGPAADAGLTGRKIIVDTYGGAAHHGGGAFSGKDPSKVDRSGAYAARWVAKNIVAAKLAERAEVQIAYAIGMADPVAVFIDTDGTEAPGLTHEDIERAVRAVFDLRPAAIIDELDLLRPIYGKTAAYGHFGREDPDFTWEKTDKAQELQEAIGR